MQKERKTNRQTENITWGEGGEKEGRQIETKTERYRDNELIKNNTGK